MFNVALIHPEIPQNTGNIGRSVLAWNGYLHLVKPIGFSLDDRYLRRAGLDYWEQLKVRVWDSPEALLEQIPADTMHLYSTRGEIRYDKAVYRPGDWLIFGSESRGIEPSLLQKYSRQTRYLPMQNLNVRSINLSSAAAIALFEALRQNDFDAPEGRA